jgi:hypothetical protein
MKCVSKNGVYDRVEEAIAETRVKNQGWNYVSKSEWKTNTRVSVSEKSELEQEKKEKTLSKKAENRKKINAKKREASFSDRIMM